MTQSPYAYQPAPAGPETQTMSQARRRPFGWWSRLTTPPPSAAVRTNPIARERYRRAQLVSGVVPVLIFLGLTQVKNALVNVPTAIGLFVLLGAIVAGVIMNRAGAITAAGIILVGGLIVTLSAALASVPSGLSLIWLPVFQIMTLAVIIAGLLLPRAMVFVTALVTNIVSAGIIFLEPRAADLGTFIQQNGYEPILLRIFAEQWVAAILVYLLSRSIEFAIARADRAEDLARAEAQIADQTRFIAEQNARLETGIQQLLETHRRVAAGDFAARTPTQQDNELWQIGISLNNLISRFGRLAYVEQQQLLTEQAIQMIAAQIEVARHCGRPQWPAPQGLPSDQILVALGVAAQFRPSASNPGWQPVESSQIGPTATLQGEHQAGMPPSLPGSERNSQPYTGRWSDSYPGVDSGRRS